MISGPNAQMIIDEAPIDLYLSADDNGVIDWPWRMLSSKKTHDNLVDNCESYIMDSTISDDSIDNEQVLQKAEQFGVDLVVLSDVYGDMEATVESIREGVDLVDDVGFSGEVLIPLQPPHDECYRRLEDCGTWFGVGGVKDASTAAKVSAAERIRQEAGYDIQLHAFGWGGTDGVVRAIRENPDLVDSMDSSAAYQDALTDVLSRTWESSARPSGVTPVIASNALGRLLEILRRMNPDLTLDPADAVSGSASEAEW